jgi:hypothetical protein
LAFLFAVTLFVSSALLFLVQPMFAKMILPRFGGTPGVWNTCMVFFQAALLAGYGYAHVTTAWLGVRRQALLQLGLLLLACVSLPITAASGWDSSGGAAPLPRLFLLLLVSVGLPFFAVSTSAPLLQKWFASTGHRSAGDPYFLYGASNLGSMLALVSYPALLEPFLPLAEHSRLWTWGYGLLVALTLACALFVWRSRKPDKETGRQGDKETEPSCFSLSPCLPVSLSSPLPRFRWVLLAFVPSSLMLSVTTYLTTDIAAIPLFWVIPLALYLLTFILVFSRRRVLPHSWMVNLLPLMVLVLTVVILSEATQPVWLLLSVHLLTFFVVAMVCHGELARQRPAAEHLTEFYLWLSVGGVLGGLFNTLVAPLVFTSVAEYPLVLVLACLLRPNLQRTEDRGQRTEDRATEDRATADSGQSHRRSPLSPPRATALDLALPAVLSMVTAGLVLGVQAFQVQPGPLSLGLMFGLPAVFCYTFVDRRLRFALGIGALLLASLVYTSVQGRTLYRERSFFGVHRVTVDPQRGFHVLVHGNTIHGKQRIGLAPETVAGPVAFLAAGNALELALVTALGEPVWLDRRPQPLSYYYRTGPVGHLFQMLGDKLARVPIAVVGLGAGSLARYGRPGQQLTFYEIDPAVQRIAENPAFFTYLHTCRAGYEVKLGDARLELVKAADQSYGMIVIDAFSSDAIPLHLLTREALELYLDKLAPDGILFFNISNRYLHLEPVLGDLAGELGLVARSWSDLFPTEADTKAGKTRSHWVLLARQEADLGKLAQHPRWDRLRPRPGAAVWTDDFSNIFSVFQWD